MEIVVFKLVNENIIVGILVDKWDWEYDFRRCIIMFIIERGLGFKKMKRGFNFWELLWRGINWSVLF